MEYSGNIPIFNIPGTLFQNIPRKFIRNFFRIHWEYIIGMFHEYSTNIYLPGGLELSCDITAPTQEHTMNQKQKSFDQQEMSVKLHE